MALIILKTDSMPFFFSDKHSMGKWFSKNDLQKMKSMLHLIETYSHLCK
jgi:hypothetical protein